MTSREGQGVPTGEHIDYVRSAILAMHPSAFEPIWQERELLLESLDAIEEDLLAARDTKLIAAATIVIQAYDSDNLYKLCEAIDHLQDVLEGRE